MQNINLAPYIFFAGNCREAMESYKNIFGGELTLMSYDDMPNDFPGKEKMSGKIMNSSLNGGDIVIMASDTENASAASKKVELCLTGNDETKLRRIFDGLSEGGTVRSPLKKEFWGDIFGTVTDRYGVDWMVDISVEQ